jgi:phytoene synthase
MCAIYAFMRYCDDLSDEPGANRAAIDKWRAEMEDALEGRFSGHPVWPAFHHTVRRFVIPHQYFRDMIDGVAGDLEPRRFETFDELYRYCYQVASVVGLTIIHIFGFDTQSALPLAEKCGIAFQLTNILRDIREDAGNGRVYLPAEDLRRFGVTEEVLNKGERTPQVIELMRFEVARARSYYEQSAPLLDLIHPRSRPSLWALIAIYSQLLERIEQKGYDVFSGRVRLSAWEKSLIVIRAFAG